MADQQAVRIRPSPPILATAFHAGAQTCPRRIECARVRCPDNAGNQTTAVILRSRRCEPQNKTRGCIRDYQQRSSHPAPATLTERGLKLQADPITGASSGWQIKKLGRALSISLPLKSRHERFPDRDNDDGDLAVGFCLWRESVSRCAGREMIRDSSLRSE